MKLMTLSKNMKNILIFVLIASLAYHFQTSMKNRIEHFGFAKELVKKAGKLARKSIKKANRFTKKSVKKITDSKIIKKIKKTSKSAKKRIKKISKKIKDKTGLGILPWIIIAAILGILIYFQKDKKAYTWAGLVSGIAFGASYITAIGIFVIGAAHFLRPKILKKETKEDKVFSKSLVSIIFFNS